MKAFNEDPMANSVSVCYWNKDDVCVFVAEGLDNPKHVAAFVEYCRLLELKYPEYANHSIGHLYKVISDFYKHMGIVANALRKNGFGEEVQEFITDVTSSQSYHEALAVMMRWVDVR